MLHTGGYGAAELSKFYPRSMSRSLILSIMLQVALIATFDVFREPEGTYVRPEHRPPHTPVGPIPIPISFNGDAPFGISRPVRHVAGLRFAIPVPVPVEDTASRDLTRPHRMKVEVLEREGMLQPVACGMGMEFNPERRSPSHPSSLRMKDRRRS